MNSGTITKIVSTLAVSAFLSAMAPAQSPSLKGHVVGETVQQFLGHFRGYGWASCDMPKCQGQEICEEI